MAYNEIEVNGNLIKGMKGLGRGGVAPTAQGSKFGLNNKLTATDEGWCWGYLNVTGGSYSVRCNEVVLGYFNSNISTNRYVSFGFPVAKGAQVWIEGSGGTLHECRISILNYNG